MPLIITILLFLLVFGPPAQRNPDCDVVAWVNQDIITKEAFSSALEDHREELAREIQNSGKSRDDINLEFERARSSVLDQMIDDLLLDQRANQLGLETDPEVIKAIEDPNPGLHPCCFNPVPDDVMAAAGIDLEHARSTHRKLVFRDVVIQREVLIPIYNAVTEEDRRAYYEGHRDEFKVPEKASLSEVFLPFDGSESQVEIDALRLVVDLRSGANFIKAVMDNTPTRRASRANGGLLGSFLISDLKPGIAAAILSLMPGDFSQPVRFDDGYAIFRLDARTHNSWRTYSDPEVQEKISRTITMSRAGAARTNYLTQLRSRAHIDICPSMR